jgi:hypothetical protein
LFVPIRAGGDQSVLMITFIACSRAALANTS